MLCIYRHGTDTYEFDAPTRREKEKKARAWAKEQGWKFEDLEKEK